MNKPAQSQRQEKNRPYSYAYVAQWQSIGLKPRRTWIVTTQRHMEHKFTNSTYSNIDPNAPGAKLTMENIRDAVGKIRAQRNAEWNKYLSDFERRMMYGMKMMKTPFIIINPTDTSA